MKNPDRQGGDGKRLSSASLTVGVLPRILMQPQEWEKVKEVFSAALEQPVAERAQFLAESCGDDEALRGEVESLLAAHEEPKNLLDQHTIDLAAQLQTDGDKYRGKRFGAYRILWEIGRGGMGAVFLAERADGDFQQQVALKIIRQSFADSDIKKHFRRERQDYWISVWRSCRNPRRRRVE